MRHVRVLCVRWKIPTLWGRACHSGCQGHLAMATPRESPAAHVINWRSAIRWRTVQPLGVPAEDARRVVSNWHRGAEDAIWPACAAALASQAWAGSRSGRPWSEVRRAPLPIRPQGIGTGFWSWGWLHGRVGRALSVRFVRVQLCPGPAPSRVLWFAGEQTSSNIARPSGQIVVELAWSGGRNCHDCGQACFGLSRELGRQTRPYPAHDFGHTWPGELANLGRRRPNLARFGPMRRGSPSLGRSASCSAP